MLPVLAPILGAAIGGGASVIGGAMQNSAAERASDKQMAFQERSARHSYQWATQDMRKAGINPILAYKQGGSGTLSGSSYTPQNIGAAFASGAAAGAGPASSAVQASRQQIELDNIKADTALKSAQDKTQAALQIQALAQAGQANANSALATQQTANAFATERAIMQDFHIRKPQATIATFDDEFWRSPAAAPLLVTRRIMESLNPGISSATSLAKSIR